MTVFYVITSQRVLVCTGAQKTSTGKNSSFFYVSAYMYGLHQQNHYCKIDNPV